MNSVAGKERKRQEPRLEGASKASLCFYWSRWRATDEWQGVPRVKWCERKARHAAVYRTDYSKERLETDKGQHLLEAMG